MFPPSPRTEDVLLAGTSNFHPVSTGRLGHWDYSNLSLPRSIHFVTKVTMLPPTHTRLSCNPSAALGWVIPSNVPHSKKSLMELLQHIHPISHHQRLYIIIQVCPPVWDPFYRSTWLCAPILVNFHFLLTLVQFCFKHFVFKFFIGPPGVSLNVAKSVLLLA